MKDWPNVWYSWSCLRCVEATYRYGCDTYVVEFVISGGVAWRDYSERWRKRYKRSTTATPARVSRHHENHLRLESLQLKSCGDLHLNGLVSARHRSNNKYQLMLMVAYMRRTGMPGHEVALQRWYVEQPVNITPLSLFRKILCYFPRWAGAATANGSTFFKTRPVSVKTLFEDRT